MARRSGRPTRAITLAYPALAGVFGRNAWELKEAATPHSKTDCRLIEPIDDADAMHEALAVDQACTVNHDAARSDEPAPAAPRGRVLPRFLKETRMRQVHGLA
jgi:hypothetical protein